MKSRPCDILQPLCGRYEGPEACPSRGNGGQTLVASTGRERMCSCGRAQTVSMPTMVAACRKAGLNGHLRASVWDLAGMPNDAAYCVVLMRHLQTRVRFNTSASMLQSFEAGIRCLLDTCNRFTAMLPLLCGFDAQMQACDQTSDAHKRFSLPFGRLMARCLACAALQQMHAGAGRKLPTCK